MGEGSTVVGRSHGLDALKAALTLLVVFHHSAITYGATGAWFYRELEPSQSWQSLLLVFFCTINQSYFMGAFFLIAGYFTLPAIERHGYTSFIHTRLVKLGIPLLVFGCILAPITVAISSTAKGDSFTVVLLGLWQKVVFIHGPLWFAQALLFLSLVAVAVHIAMSLAGDRKFNKTQAQVFPSNTSLFTGAVLCGVIAFALRLRWPITINTSGMLLGYFSSYVMLFFAGYWAAKNRWLEQIPCLIAKQWRRVMWITLPLLTPLAFLTTKFSIFAADPAGGWSIPALMYAMWEPFVAVGAILTLLVYFESRYKTLTTFQEKLSRRAYGIFIFHAPVLVAISVAWRTVDVPALFKFAISGALTCAISYAVVGLLLRIPKVGRVL